MCVSECEESRVVRHIATIHQQLVTLIFGFQCYLLKERISSAGSHNCFRDCASKTGLKGCGTSMRLLDRIFKHHRALKIVIGAHYSDRYFERGEIPFTEKFIRFRFQRMGAASAETAFHNSRDYCEI